MNYFKREQERLDADFALVRAAINKRWNAPGEVSTVLANAALDRIAYSIGAGEDSRSSLPVAPGGPVSTEDGEASR